MSTIYVPGLLQIKPQYSQEPDAPDHPENVTWWLNPGGAGPLSSSVLTAIAAAFDPKWGAVFTAYAGVNMHYYGCIITDYTSAAGLSYNSVGTYAGVVGTQGTLQPPQVAALISGKVGIRYRGGHPRIYLPYVGGSSLTDEYMDSLSSTVVTNMTTAYTALNTTMNGLATPGGGLYQTMYSRKTGVCHQWTGFVVNGLLATQRRRLRKPSRRR